jgi:hypothetical protein
VPNAALLSPLTIPYFVLPTWLAPAYEKLLEIILSVGGCVLFLRRLGVSRPAAVVGGLVFAGSAFMVVWLDFPQTQVAAFVPAVFWAVERSIQNARLRNAALISLPVAAMLLGGFPAVAGYTFLTVGCYALVLCNTCRACASCSPPTSSAAPAAYWDSCSPCSPRSALSCSYAAGRAWPCLAGTGGCGRFASPRAWGPWPRV